VLVFLGEVGLPPAELERLILLPRTRAGAGTRTPSGPEQVGLAATNYVPFLTCMFPPTAGGPTLLSNMWGPSGSSGTTSRTRWGRAPLPSSSISFAAFAAGVVHALTKRGTRRSRPSAASGRQSRGSWAPYYFVLFPRARIVVLFPVLFLPFFFEVPAFVYLLVWYLSQIVGATAGPERRRPSRWAGSRSTRHVGGFVSGAPPPSRFFLGAGAPRAAPRSGRVRDRRRLGATANGPREKAR